MARLRPWAAGFPFAPIRKISSPLNRPSMWPCYLLPGVLEGRLQAPGPSSEDSRIKSDRQHSRTSALGQPGQSGPRGCVPARGRARPVSWSGTLNLSGGGVGTIPVAVGTLSGPPATTGTPGKIETHKRCAAGIPSGKCDFLDLLRGKPVRGSISSLFATPVILQIGSPSSRTEGGPPSWAAFFSTT